MRLVLPHNKTRLIEMVQELVTEPKCAGGWLWQFEKFNPETGKWDKSQPMKWEHAKQARAQAMLDAATGILMIPRKRHESGRWQDCLPDAKTCAELLKRRGTV